MSELLATLGGGSGMRLASLIVMIFLIIFVVYLVPKILKIILRLLESVNPSLGKTTEILLVKILEVLVFLFLLFFTALFCYFAWMCGSSLLLSYERGMLTFAEGASYGWTFWAVLGLGSTIAAIWCAKFLFLMIKERFFD